MTSSIGFFCGNSDIAELTEFARSIGLHLIPMSLDQTDVGEVWERPGCYLSAISREELHPYGTPPVNVSAVTDPLLLFMRAYNQPPYLVLGVLQWNTDNLEFATITRPYYQKIGRWIRKQWRKPAGSDFYFGPEAMDLLANGAQTVNSLPEIPVTTVTV